MRIPTYFRASLAAAALLLAAVALHAQSNEPVVVQTFTYGSAPNGKFVLPPLSQRFEKVLMHYKLRCPFDGPCGEWDYLMYIYLFDHTGRVATAPDTGVSFRVDGVALDSIGYVRTPTWRYWPHIERLVTRDSRSAFDSAVVGAGSTSTASPFDCVARSGRTQYLWRKDELLAAGLKAGDITGIRFNVATPGSELGKLVIRMKAIARDTVTPGYYETDGFTTVYEHGIRFVQAGWTSLQFPTSFAWNGTTNIVVDVSFENSAAGGTATQVLGAQPSFAAGVTTTTEDRSLHFEGVDFVDVPSAAFAPIDSAITIAFWAYGNPPFQPQDQMAFEGVDKDGYRVLNVHLPWSDGTVYWDAGLYAGRYDRVSKAANASDYEGKWTYWTFTKNVKTGSMKIYMNGALFTSGTSKKKDMRGVAKFRLGSSAEGTLSYDGNINDFAVWAAEVDPATIRGWMGRSAAAAAHPFRSALRVFYPMNENATSQLADSSGLGFNGRLVGPPGSWRTMGPDLHIGLSPITIRPNVVFEQGVYASHVDTTVGTDSVQADPFSIVRYRTTADSSVPTDTLIVWPAAWRYRYNKLGVAVDSVRVLPDTVLHQTRTPYNRRFEVVNRYELGRYITPYGNGLSLGEGFTWTYDVSDFRPLLHDTVDLSAYNQQELVDLSFEFVPGTPPRDPISVTNLWNGGFGYGLATSIEEALHPLRVKIPADAANSRVKITPTGHGFGGTQNCAEFCAKEHSINVDGTKRFARDVWRETCSLNPVYPQGGTWVYSRTNWCPGAEVWAYDFELTPWAHAGDSVTLDYNIEPYTWNGQGSQPYYQIETQLITYGAPNFTLDAAVEMIKSPSKTDLYKRMNPICANPVITIRNTGSTKLTGLDIQYGVEGATPSTQHWTGSLDFMESVDVELGTFSWTGATPARKFTATVSNPNGGSDQYANNNTKVATYDLPPQWQSQLVFELKTNNSGLETRYQLVDAVTGRVVLDRRDLDDATVYRDTVTLPDGCYEFRLIDLGGDGLSWWANTDAGTGYMRVRRVDNGSVIRTFNPDFGGEIYQQFSVGLNLSDVPTTGTSTEASWMAAYPNPTSGQFTLEVSLRNRADCELSVVDLLGAEVYHTRLKDLQIGSIPIDLGKVTAGTYVVRLQAGEETLTRKVVVQ